MIHSKLVIKNTLFKIDIDSYLREKGLSGAAKVKTPLTQKKTTQTALGHLKLLIALSRRQHR